MVSETDVVQDKADKEGGEHFVKEMAEMMSVVAVELSDEDVPSFLSVMYFSLCYMQVIKAQIQGAEECGSILKALKAKPSLTKAFLKYSTAAKEFFGRNNLVILKIYS